MPFPESLILMIMGAAFVGLGGGLLFLGCREERSYYDDLASRYDMKDFLEQSSERPGLGSLRTGGMISMIVGGVLLGVGQIGVLASPLGLREVDEDPHVPLEPTALGVKVIVVVNLDLDLPLVGLDVR